MKQTARRIALLITCFTLVIMVHAQVIKDTVTDSVKIKTDSLKAVTITASKPFIKQKVDKTIVTVAGSPLAAGGNAWEVLVRAPGIVEQGNNLQLKGKTVTVLMDGRYTNMSGEDLKNMLNAMPANRIERIELMPNPSARYDAQGGSIINIIMAKNTKLGVNGSATLGGRAGKYGSWNTGLSLNYRSKKVNVYGSYDYLNNQQFNESSFNRFINNGKHIADNVYGTDQRSSHSIKAGLDYDLNKRNSFGILIKGLINNIDKTSGTRSMADYTDVDNDSLSMVVANGKARYIIPSVNLYYKAILDTAGKEVRFNADYFSYNKKWNDHFTTRYFDPRGAEYDAKLLRADAPATNDIKSFSIDYKQPIKKGSLEVGTKISQATTDNDAVWEQGRNGTWAKDFGKTNHFIYKENVYAAYVNVNKEFKKISLMMGVRAEQTHTEGTSVTSQQTNKNKYLNFFPNMAIQYNAAKDHLFAFSYRQSIERYKYDIVNPFIVYKSQYSYYQGNPYLNPGIQHNFELSYVYNNELFTTLTYSRFEDVLTNIYRKDSTSPAVINTWDNLSSADYMEAAVSHSKSLFNNKWMTNNTVAVSYAKFNAPAGSDLNNAKVTTILSSDNTILLPKGYKVQVSAVYFSPMALGVVSYKSRFNMNLGMSKTVLENKGTIALSVSDLFNTYNSTFTVASFGIQSTNYVKPETRFVKLTFTYRFGNKNVKANANRKTSIENESRRMQ
ncbi:TonB-dependent receptor [Pseudoflavitalea sp. X16]|uniref:outer membrane beta-barrel family protein n=1 Tax=Paraflavitalea devenefica TaxID=2716334 RepID=UPI0014217C3B|nr:outer membrane beta-barrel family protein [Paraflavitalea devenefica]NII25102.1 TonB-dependent receptor [Paraflavitalea devenefica]